MSAWTQLHQSWRGHSAFIAALHFCFRIRTRCCIFKAEWCWKWHQIMHF